MNEKKRKIQPATDIIQKAGDSNEANRTQGKGWLYGKPRAAVQGRARADATGAWTLGGAAGRRHHRGPLLF